VPEPLTTLRRLVLPLLVVAAACTDGSTDVTAPVTKLPIDIGDGWTVGSMAQHRIDPSRIMDLSDRIDLGEFDHVHSLIIAREGDLVFEEYYRDHSPDSLHTLQSVTKSFASTLIGIAVDEGLLELDATLPELLPSRADEIALDPLKSQIRLRDLLTMRAGLQWDEWGCDYQDVSCNSNRQMNESDDWVGFVLSQPVIETPGTRFVYNSGVSNLLSAILKDATGQDPARFAEQNLFGPLQIDDYRWYRNTLHSDSLPHFGGGLRLRTRDLGKLGQLYLDHGRWRGRQIVSSEWVANSTTAREQVSLFDYYGFQWWTRALDGRMGHRPSPEDVWFGWGYGGQHVFVVPSLELVVVVNSWNADGSTKAFELLGELLNAVGN
jgi:CubicO group peptidase (beta-lactamase class C family)